MRIALTGGGSGGHFYPLIAVAEAIEDLVKERALIEPELYYIGPEPFDRAALLEHDIIYAPSAAGRLRKDAGRVSPIGMLKTFFGVIASVFQLYRIYPDVVFSTGGFAAFPTLFAARILLIPVIIYDADTTPGKVSLWSAKFAKWIAVAHPDAPSLFPQKFQNKIVQVGLPIRKEILNPSKEGGYEFLNLDKTAPTIFVMGGSQGAQAINEVVLDALPLLVEKYNVVHQAGSANVEEVSGIAQVSLKSSRYSERYRCFGLLNTLAMRMTAGITSLIIMRAGSGTIFEVASWGIPAIIVPIPESISHDQTKNAFSYARSGAALVIEQQNLKPHLLVAEIDRLMASPELRAQMSQAAHAFARPDASSKIAKALIDICVEHEPV